MPRSTPLTARDHLLEERPLRADGGAASARLAPGASSARSVTVNRAESPLAWLHAHGHIDRRQFDAGERLRADYETAQMQPSITMRWDASPVSGARRAAPDHLESGERQLAAKQRFDHALAALGKDLNDIAWRVICSGEALPTVERDLGWPSRSGKLVLRLALDRLAEFYRIPGERDR